MAVSPRAKKTELARQISQLWIDERMSETEGALNAELDHLLTTSRAPEGTAKWEKEFRSFRGLFKRYLTEKAFIDWNKISPLPEDAIVKHSHLEEPAPTEVKSLLSQLVIVKLNGGLGTSMGCKGPKSVIPVRNDLTFLDLLLQQISHLNRLYDVSVPLVLMNSFNTHDDTAKVIKKYQNVRVQIDTFQQSMFPRIHKESLQPIVRDLDWERDIEGWYPPGHGDFYESFNNSGLLDKYLAEGKRYCFVSNIDNMGATPDVKILNAMVKEGRDFIMEVTDKTRADVKGGTLINYAGKTMLLEIAQVPKDHVEDFKSVSKFRIFNTNNLWCDLSAAKKLIEAGQMNMEIIKNPKHISFGGAGVDVIQLETAAGAAIKNFSNALGINVPRSRFLPVKKTQDLLLVMSNLYDLENGRLALSSKRAFGSTPIVKLGSSFDKVNMFVERFAGVPDILELDHLTVSGDVWFGKGVSLKGTVIVIANHGDRIDIPNGSILENKIVSGNLRILEH